MYPYTKQKLILSHYWHWNPMVLMVVLLGPIKRVSPRSTNLLRTYFLLWHVISHSIKYVKMSIGNLNKQCGLSMYLVVCVLLEHDISLTRATNSNVENCILLSLKHCKLIVSLLGLGLNQPFICYREHYLTSSFQLVFWDLSEISGFKILLFEIISLFSNSFPFFPFPTCGDTELA